jgi:hypothetical protein
MESQFLGRAVGKGGGVVGNWVSQFLRDVFRFQGTGNVLVTGLSNFLLLFAASAQTLWDSQFSFSPADMHYAIFLKFGLSSSYIRHRKNM